jgi:hypothetical protein
LSIDGITVDDHDAAPVDGVGPRGIEQRAGYEHAQR